MGLYGKYLLPRLVHSACRGKPNMLQRKRIVPAAQGRVLEVGIGSGLNLAFYDSKNVSKVWGLDPSQELTRMAAGAIEAAPFDVELIIAGAESIPLENHSVDTVLITYTLCTIAGPHRALAEMARVLKPGGRLLFCEHGRSPDASVARWQHRLNPLWSRMGGGCNLDRDIPDLIRSNGFHIQELRSEYIPGWRPASFNFWGTAAPD